MLMSRQELEGLGENLIFPFNPDHLTPQGYDFSLAGIYQMNGMGVLSVDNAARQLPDYYPAPAGPRYLTGDNNTKGWYLRAGVYIGNLCERVMIPNDLVGLMWPRSSLTRMGATLNTAVFDAGYEGISAVQIEVMNPMGIWIEQGARIGHMLFFKLDEATEHPYNGVYKGAGGSFS